MAQAISSVIRSLIIEHHQSGLSNPTISSKVGKPRLAAMQGEAFVVCVFLDDGV